MRYRDILGSSFRALKNGALWGFGVSALLVSAVPFVLVGIAIRLAFPADRVAALMDMPAQGAVPSSLVSFLAIYATLIIGALLAWPLFLIAHAGLVHLSSEIVGGQSVTVSQGWSFGVSRFGRAFGVEALTGLVNFGAFVVIVGPVYALLFGSIMLSERYASPGAAIAGICCGELIYFVALLAFVLFSQTLEPLTIRYG
ncbi:MAG: hypothetical protein FDZ75_06555, partial [Actinobacteria bacterium]